MDQFLQGHDLPKLMQETDSLNRPIPVKEVELTTVTFPNGASPDGTGGKEPAYQCMWDGGHMGSNQGREDPLEEEVDAHSSILA